MNTSTPPSYCAFRGVRRLAHGSLSQVARAAAAAQATATDEPLLVFDPDGRQIDLDLRGTSEEAAARAEAAVAESAPQAAPASPPPRGRGRPQLGVVAREVTLLPRHWDWLNNQPGGASVVLRRLVDEARHANPVADRIRRARESTYRFMTAVAGNEPGYEEATRALFAGDRAHYDARIAGWPRDVRYYARMLSLDAFEKEP